jgi:hypothetical protein
MLAVGRGPLVVKKHNRTSGHGPATIKNIVPLKNVSLPSVLVYNFPARAERHTDVNV